MSARSVSRWLLTELYSPVAIDMAPAATPAKPATMIDDRVASDAATPMRRAAIDTMPSPAPSTAARSHPIRPYRWRSGWPRPIARPATGSPLTANPSA
jgi:hypothetical protein